MSAHSYRQPSRALRSLVAFGLATGLAAMVFWGARLLARRHRRLPDPSAYDHIIWEAARRHRVPPLLVKAVIRQESSFRPWVTGGRGETGLMQITDGAVKDWERHTGQRCRVRGLRYNPRLNIEIGTWYLGMAMKQWHGYRDREILALAQYNAGRTNARRWAPDDPRTKVNLEHIRFPSTREYIRRVLSHWQTFEEEYRDRGQR